MLSLLASQTSGEASTIYNPYNFFPWLGLTIIVTNFVCFTLYANILKRYSATLISLGGLLAPVSAAIASWFYFYEPITTNMLIAAVFIIIGFTVFYYDELKKYIHK